jgi:hypothetical protein
MSQIRTLRLSRIDEVRQALFMKSSGVYCGNSVHKVPRLKSLRSIARVAYI